MLNNKLKELRTYELISQKEMAEKLGIQRSTYSDYENEHKTIPIKHLITFCDYFNVSLDFIFNFSNTEKYYTSKENIDKKNAGIRLKEFRKSNNLTQVKLAEILKTDQAVIANYEKGKHIIATPFLYAICKEYHISADYLLGKTEEPKYLN